MAPAGALGRHQTGAGKFLHLWALNGRGIGTPSTQNPIPLAACGPTPLLTTRVEAPCRRRRQGRRDKRAREEEEDSADREADERDRRERRERRARSPSGASP